MYFIQLQVNQKYSQKEDMEIQRREEPAQK